MLCKVCSILHRVRKGVCSLLQSNRSQQWKCP